MIEEPISLVVSGLINALTTFVALNAVMFAALAVAKILPKIYLNDWTRTRNERSESRNIHPDPPSRQRARRRPAKIRRRPGQRIATQPPQLTAPELPGLQKPVAGLERHEIP